MINDYLSLIAQLVPDAAGRLAADAGTLALAAAVQRYSVARPRMAVSDVVSPGGRVLPLPIDWSDGLSRLDGIETPIGQVPPTQLPRSAWLLYRAPTGLEIQLDRTLDVGTPVRLAYTAAHVVSALQDSIPPVDRDLVARYAAAQLCDQLATFYADDTDATIVASGVQGQTRSQAFASRAREYRKQFAEAIGSVDPAAKPACAVVSFQPKSADGESFLFHPRRRM